MGSEVVRGEQMVVHRQLPAEDTEVGDSPIVVVGSPVVVVGILVFVALGTVEAINDTAVVGSLEPVDIDLVAGQRPWEAAGVDSPVVEDDTVVVVDSLELVGIPQLGECIPIGLVDIEVTASEGTQLVDRNSIAFLILNYNISH